jgi:hypothetical protein
MIIVSLLTYQCMGTYCPTRNNFWDASAVTKKQLLLWSEYHLTNNSLLRVNSATAALCSMATTTTKAPNSAPVVCCFSY